MVDWRIYLMAQHLSHIGLLHDLSSPVPFQHSVLDDNRYSSQDEGHEQISMNIIPSTAQFPVKGQKLTA